MTVTFVRDLLLLEINSCITPAKGQMSLFYTHCTVLITFCFAICNFHFAILQLYTITVSFFPPYRF